MDAEVLLGMVFEYTARDYNTLVRDVRLQGVDVARRTLQCAFRCTAPYLNPLRRLHGGCVATLVDVVGTAAILATDKHNRPGVTTDLNVSYMEEAEEDQELLLTAKVLKCGKDLAFVQVDFANLEGTILFQGRMTKCTSATPSIMTLAAKL